MVGLGEPRLEPAAEVGPRPGAAAVGSRVRPARDRRHQLCLLRCREPSRRPPLRPIPEPGQALGIVAQHRIAQRLPLHARKPRRFRSAQPLQRMGNRVYPRRYPSIAFPPRRMTQRSGRQIVPDLERRPHAIPHTSPTKGNHTLSIPGIPRQSQVKHSAV